jgi:hypothetical protein
MNFLTNILVLHSSKGNNTSIEWNTVFIELLKASLEQLTGKSVSFQTQDYQEAVDKKYNAQIVISILTKNDLANLSILENIAKATEPKNPSQHWYIIIPNSISSNSMPGALKLKPAYTFFDSDPVAGLIRNYEVSENSDTSRLFWSKLLDLSYDICLDLLPESNKRKINGAIYLAETTSDQYENYDIVKSELIHRGFTVYPEHLLTGNLEDLNLQISDYLSKCLMSVHIAGNNYGEIIKDSEYSLIELQYRASAKRWKENMAGIKNAPFQRLIWSQPGTKPADERQRWFVGSLRSEEKDAFTEIMQSPIEELKANLRRKILLFNNSSSGKATGKSSNSIYIIHEQKDLKKIEELSLYFKNSGSEVLTINFEKQTDNLVSTHYEYLAKAKAVIICDFECNSLWMNSKLKDVMKAPGFGRTEQFLAKAIYTTKRDRYVGFLENDVNLIIDANLKVADALKPFMQKINKK